MSATTAKSRIVAALQTGPKTTAELCQPDVGGVRFGGRIYELREEGHQIVEQRLRAGSSLYTLVGRVAAGPAAVRSPVAGDGPRATGGGGHETIGRLLARAREISKDGWEHGWMCPRCAYARVDGSVCPRGHQAVRGWSLDALVLAAEGHVEQLAEAA